MAVDTSVFQFLGIRLGIAALSWTPAAADFLAAITNKYEFDLFLEAFCFVYLPTAGLAEDAFLDGLS